MIVEFDHHAPPINMHMHTHTHTLEQNLITIVISWELNPIMQNQT